MKAKQLADKWIKEMEEAGMSPDQMIDVINLARQKYVALIEKSKVTLCDSCARLKFSPPDEEHYCQIDYELKPVSKRPVKCDGYLNNKSIHKVHNSTTCECGNQHPLVAEFGKCGSCYTKILGEDPTYS